MQSVSALHDHIGNDPCEKFFVLVFFFFFLIAEVNEGRTGLCRECMHDVKTSGRELLKSVNAEQGCVFCREFVIRRRVIKTNDNTQQSYNYRECML